jgi:hypothetical protein
LCYNPKSKVVLIANDETFDNFITFIDAKFYQVIQKINFNGKDPTGNNILANGLEQCIWNPRDGKFYMNIPNTVQGSNTTAPGVTLVISGTAPFKIEKVFDFSKAPLNTTGCTGGAGIALGPNNQLALSCGLIINDQTGSPIANFPSEGGADEIWFNPGDNHYFFADTGTVQLGVIDAGPPPSADGTATTGTGSHSVTADSVTNEVYVPIRGNNAVTPAGTSKACSKANDAFGLAGSDVLGCILAYIAPSDQDDAPPPSTQSTPGAEEGAVHLHDGKDYGGRGQLRAVFTCLHPGPRMAPALGHLPPGVGCHAEGRLACHLNSRLLVEWVNPHCSIVDDDKATQCPRSGVAACGARFTGKF